MRKELFVNGGVNERKKGKKSLRRRTGAGDSFGIKDMKISYTMLMIITEGAMARGPT